MSNWSSREAAKRRKKREEAEMLGLPDPFPIKKKGKQILNPKKVKLIKARIAGATLEEAARKAGYNGNKSVLQQQANNIMQSAPAKELVAEARKEVQIELAYTAKSAMLEAQESMEFARETGNANALVKAVELRAKLQGLLTEKIDIRAAVGFHVNIKGIDHGGSGSDDGMLK